jgi:hypothetical protein
MRKKMMISFPSEGSTQPTERARMYDCTLENAYG